MVFRILETMDEMASDVVVALVEVELSAVKFCSVLDPVTNAFESVVRPPVTFNVPVKLASADIVWPFMVPLAVSEPVVNKVEKRLVDDAVVAKKLVVVALVEVELRAVKFCSVLDPLTKRFVNVLSAEKVLVPLNVLLSPRRVVEEKVPAP